MQCPNCGFDNRMGARFCGRCGSALPVGATPAPIVFSVAAPSPETGAHGGVPDAYDVEQPRRRPAWILALVSFVLSCSFSVCLVMGLAALPALSATVPPAPESNLTQPDLTLFVQEAYISDMVGHVLPESVNGETTVDVQPGNVIVVATDMKLLIVRLNVLFHVGVAVADGQIQVWIERIETGGRNLLDLIGVDQFTLGQAITERIQSGLEAELGEGIRLLDITTSEDQVILTARWE